MTTPDQATHWKDARGLVITSAQRERLGYDYQTAYNVPCKKMSTGSIKPLAKCKHCDGRGQDPLTTFDPCPVCGRSGGLS